MKQALIYQRLALLVPGLLLIAGLWAWADPDPFVILKRIREFVQALGPASFFLAMALLPAVGVPLSLFCLAAGTTLSGQLGFPVVLLASLAAISVNMALSYLLALRALRPLLGRLMHHFGHTPPTATPGNAGMLVLLVRATPGLPFPAQNYLLGMARVPFMTYLAVSCAVAFPLNAALILFGQTLVEGRGRVAVAAVLGFMALAAGMRLVRRRYLAGRTRQSAQPAMEVPDTDGR